MDYGTPGELDQDDLAAFKAHWEQMNPSTLPEPPSDDEVLQAGLQNQQIPLSDVLSMRARQRGRSDSWLAMETAQAMRTRMAELERAMIDLSPITQEQMAARLMSQHPLTEEEAFRNPEDDEGQTPEEAGWEWQVDQPFRQPVIVADLNPGEDGQPFEVQLPSPQRIEMSGREYLAVNMDAVPNGDIDEMMRVYTETGMMFVNDPPQAVQNRVGLLESMRQANTVQYNPNMNAENVREALEAIYAERARPEDIRIPPLALGEAGIRMYDEAMARSFADSYAAQIQEGTRRERRGRGSQPPLDKQDNSPGIW